MLCKSLCYILYDKKTSSSTSSSSSALDRKGCCSASDAEKRLCGLSSIHSFKKSKDISSSQSGLRVFEVAHCMSFKKVIGFSLRPGSVASNVQSAVSSFMPC